MRRSPSVLLCLVALSSCVVPPTGPSVMVLPRRGADLERFQHDDVICRQWALGRTGLEGADAQSGTAADDAPDSQWSAQQRYDVAYMQCMYAKGHRIPIPGGSSLGESPEAQPDLPPPPDGEPPPPPPSGSAP